ncbi:hypothetical protein HU200_036064 [Digitaria exilis]|uniref:Uncharacterized protein n=1 Tax=Digitaria exilis TaxID=1010633 RepID=A0A835BHL6_9POAL|nr:hypothetical protein HU200_036064 [Digitaria exilis]
MGDLGPEPPPRQGRPPAAPGPPRARRAEAEREARRMTSMYSDFELELASGFGLCFFLGALLMCNVTCSAAMTVRRVYAADARFAAATGEAIFLSVGTALYFGMMALIAHILKTSHQRARARQATVSDSTPFPSLLSCSDETSADLILSRSVRIDARRSAVVLRASQIAAVWRAIYAGPFTRGLHLASCVLMVVGLLMLKHAPANSNTGRVGYMVAETGWLLHSAALCFIICKAFSIQWKSACDKLERD